MLIPSVLDVGNVQKLWCTLYCYVKSPKEHGLPPMLGGGRMDVDEDTKFVVWFDKCLGLGDLEFVARICGFLWTLWYFKISKPLLG